MSNSHLSDMHSLSDIKSMSLLESSSLGSAQTQLFTPANAPADAVRIDHLERQIEALNERIDELQQSNSKLRRSGTRLAHELDMFRQRRLVYWSDRFRNKFDAWFLMHPAFEQLKDDSALFHEDLHGYRLLPSHSLLRVPSLTYKIRLKRAALSAVQLAPIIDVPSAAGLLRLHIKDGSGNLLAESVSTIDGDYDEKPAVFEFESLGEKSLAELQFQVSAEGVDVPVRIFELKKFPCFGLRRAKRQLFAAYTFDYGSDVERSLDSGALTPQQ